MIRSIAIVVLTCSLVFVAGCGSKAGDARSGSGYEVDLPDGWSDDTEEAEEAETAIRFDSLLRKEREDGFATNVNVIRERVGDDVALGDVEDTYEQQLRQFGASNIGKPVERELDGDPAVVRDYDYDQQGMDLAGRQLAVVHGGRLYTVTFTALATAFDDEVAEYEQILDSWRWD